MSRIDEKIEEIEKLLDELESIMPADAEEYLGDFKCKAAGERYFERIIESIVDLAFLIIKDKKLKTPEEDKQAFEILCMEKIISKELADRLKEAKGMRNIIAHEYGEIDNSLVFHSLTEELIPDAKEFIKQIRDIK
ncbi:MAG TPA: DUF86 domain-containing protein [Candidatus Nanoarchaeia archaeon]|nr:DUF86 domain-containing protein [Candidatus Nanoarchaeia archaeon]